MKTSIIFVIFIVLSGIIHCQEAFEWANSNGSWHWDKGNCISTDANGNSFVAGEFSGTVVFGSTTLTSSGISGSGYTDIFIGKMDPMGNWIWATRAGGSDKDWATSIVHGEGGECYVTGAFWGTADFGATMLVSNGHYDIFIAKIDATGNFVWAVHAGGVDEDLGCGIALHSSNIYITGLYGATANFGTISLTSSSNFDTFISKLTPNGTFVWAIGVGSAVHDVGEVGPDIATDASGNIYVTGSYITGQRETDQAFIGKLDSNANWLWIRYSTNAGGNYAYGEGISLDSSGNSYSTGVFSGTVTFGATTLTSSTWYYNVYVVKLDSSGNWQWATSAGSTLYNHSRRISTDSGGNSYITGNFSAPATFGTTTLISSGSSDIFIAKLDSAGNWLWAKSAGGTGQDYGGDISAGGTGECYLTGSFSGSATFGNTILNSIGMVDIFTAKIGPDPYIAIPHLQTFGTANAWPLNWTQTSTGSSVWTLSNTSNAGGAAYEMKATWLAFTGTTRLISPPIRTNGITNFDVSFNTLYDDYGVGVTAKLQYSHNLSTWYDSPWSIVSGGGNVGGYQTVRISGLVNQPITYVAWFLEGNHYQFDYWYVDNVSLSQPHDHDVSPLSWDVLAAVVPENTLVTPLVTVVNNGAYTESFTVTCAIGAYTGTQTVTGLVPEQTQQVSFAPLTPALWSAGIVIVTTNLASDEVVANNILHADLICLPLDTPALANNTQTEQYVQFSLSDPGTLTALPNGFSGFSYFMSGGDWMNGKWMAVEYDDGIMHSNNYYEIDPLTGLATYLGQANVPLMGIAYDDDNNIMYGVGGNNGMLYTMNTATGLATGVAVMWYNQYGTPTNLPTLGGAMIDIAYDNLGDVLYGIDLGNDALWTINPATAELTLIGYLGIDLRYAQDAAFDQANGLLFLAGYTTFGGLYWIDTNYGGAFLIGLLGTAGYELDAFAIPYGTIAAPGITLASTGALSWNAVEGAIKYSIYKSSDPYGTFTWYSDTYSTTWTDPLFPEAKVFYQVKATGGVRSANRREVRYTEPLRKAGKLGDMRRVNNGLAP